MVKLVCAHTGCSVEFDPDPRQPRKKYCCAKHGDLASRQAWRDRNPDYQSMLRRNQAQRRCMALKVLRFMERRLPDMLKKIEAAINQRKTNEH